jgi:hypothetical protein
MANVKIFPYPDQFAIADQEVAPGKLVRSMTWTSIAHLVNHLNFFARRVLPWNSWNLLGGLGPFDFCFPVDGPNYTTRKLMVVIGLARNNIDYAAGGVQMTLKSSTDTTGTTATFAEGSSNTFLTLNESERAVNYIAREINVTGGQREKIEVTITATGDKNIIGFGAWELPPADGGAKTARASGGGVSLVKGDIADSVSNAVTPSKFFIGENIDTDLADIHKATMEAWRSNRRIIHNVGFINNSGAAANPIDLFDATNDGSWYDVTGEGLYIPAYVNNLGRTTREIRVAVKLQNQSTGTGEWRVVTDSETSSADTVSNQVLQWRPMSDGSGVFVPATDGLQVAVPLSASWIDIQTKSSGAEPHIYQVIIWEDEPDIYAAPS